MDKTIISATNESVISNTAMSAKEIIEFLENGALYRTLKDVILKVYPHDNADKKLCSGLYEICGGNPDSIARNVRNWMNGKNIPQREQLFQICFALELNDLDSNKIISFASETGIHYREPREIIYAYCLKSGKSWHRAQQLIDDILPLCEEYKEVKFLNQTPEKFTKMLKSDFDSAVSDDNELKAYILSNKNNFANLHLTAYADFIKMLSYLQDPDKDYDETYYNYILKHKNEFTPKDIKELESHMEGLKSQSVADVVEEHMKMHVPGNTGRKSGNSDEKRNFTHLQNAIKKNWPSESIIFKMRNQDIDVSRKVMILLHLLTEEFEVGTPLTDEEDNFWMLDSLEDESENASERMEIRINQLNLFLDSYGMNRIDPGNPFDCLVLYSLMASYEGESDYMSDRLDELLSILYRE